VVHDQLIGMPFGTRFEVRGRDGIVPVTGMDGGITDEILGELGEQAEAAGEAAAANGEQPAVVRDNRQLVDRNAMTHGKESSQKLGADEIKELKDQGKGTKEVMKALIENSDTFKSKTEFSQAKWLKKKAAKHAPQFTASRPSALTLCRAYFRKEPFKINHMREDALARLLTLSNVQPGSRALAVDSMNGLVLGALAERMGGMGRLMHGYNGLQPAVEAVRWFNMDAEHLSAIFHFPLSELGFVPEDKSAVKLVLAQLPVADATSGDAMQQDADDTPKEVMQQDAHSPPAQTQAQATENGQGTSAASEKAAVTPQQSKTEEEEMMEARQRRVDGAKRAQQSFNKALPVHAPSVEETQTELQRGFDCLVVAGMLSPKLLVMPLLRLLKPSSPIVVYSPTPEPLLELQELLIREEAAMNLHISESWMREQQVLPGRTHPLMAMSGSSGFLLSGIRVFKKSQKPPSRNIAVRKMPAPDTKTDKEEEEVSSPAAKKPKVGEVKIEA